MEINIEDTEMKMEDIEPTEIKFGNKINNQ